MHLRTYLPAIAAALLSLVSHAQTACEACGLLREKQAQTEQLFEDGLLEDSARAQVEVLRLSRSASPCPTCQTDIVGTAIDDGLALAARSFTVKAALLEELDVLQALVLSSSLPPAPEWRQWYQMSFSLEEGTRVLSWYLEHRDKNWRILDSQSGARRDAVVRDVFDALVELEMPIEAVRLYDDSTPYADRYLEEFNRIVAAASDINEPIPRAAAQSIAKATFTKRMSLVTAGLFAERRPSDAQRISSILLDAASGPEALAALLDSVIRFDCVRRTIYVEWLSQLESAGADVRLLRLRLKQCPSD